MPCNKPKESKLDATVIIARKVLENFNLFTLMET